MYLIYLESVVTSDLWLIAVFINIDYRDLGLKEEGFSYLGEKEEGRSFVVMKWKAL